jgi:hypothetical protein
MTPTAPRTAKLYARNDGYIFARFREAYIIGARLYLRQRDERQRTENCSFICYNQHDIAIFKNFLRFCNNFSCQMSPFGLLILADKFNLQIVFWLSGI